jgi:cytochrome c oxidase subunit II
MIDFPFFPEQASSVAGQVDLLMLGLIAISSFFTLIVVILILYFSIRYRRGAKVDRSQPPTTSMKVELSWVFLLLSLALGVYAVAAILYFRMSRVPEDAHEIYVLGRQWMWQIQHPEGPREINELHVPAGRPIRLVMTSQDVIHSFYVPAFRLKYDVIPGRYTNLSFTATTPGEYHLFCAEFCGTEHAEMIGRVIVMEPRQFQEWLNQGSQSSQAMPEAGALVYQEFGCGSCHDPGSQVNAPQLAGRYGEKVLLADGGKVTFEENYIRESIYDPMRRIAAGYEPLMPSYTEQVTEEQVQLLIAFLKTFEHAQIENEPLSNLSDTNERIWP